MNRITFISCILACSIKAGTLYMVLELLKSKNNSKKRVEAYELMKETALKTTLHIILWFTISVVCKMALSGKIRIEKCNIVLLVAVAVAVIAYTIEFTQIGGI